MDKDTGRTRGGHGELAMLRAADAKASRDTKSMQGSGAGRGGTGALQRRDLGLVEHSRDRLAALDINVVALEADRSERMQGE